PVLSKLAALHPGPFDGCQARIATLTEHARTALVDLSLDAAHRPTVPQFSRPLHAVLPQRPDPAGQTDRPRRWPHHMRDAIAIVGHIHDTSLGTGSTGCVLVISL